MNYNLNGKGRYKMTKEDKQIYFAHAMVDYDSEYEDLCIQTINKFYNNYTIINPKDINAIMDQKLSELAKFKYYFFPAINNCDIVIAAPAFNHKTRKGQFLSGTTREIIYAIKNNKPAIGLIDNKLQEIKKEFFTDIQWDVFG